MKRRRRMTAKQLKYFGKRKTRTIYIKTKRRQRSIMARRRSYRSYAKRGIGGAKSLIAPIGAGIAENILDNYLPIAGVAPTAVGMLMHDQTLKTMGLYQIGYSLGNILPIPGITSGSKGGLL